ncbi:MAG: bacteriohemerythrin [Desulfuromonadaceae bacterium]
MGTLVWKPGFEIGIEVVDRQHRLLFAYLNEGMENIADSAGIFDKLKTYASVHFADEVKLMRKNNYPGIEGHVKQHQLFEEQVEHLQSAVMDGERKTIRMLFSFLKDWFLEHILVEDSRFAGYLRATMDKDDITVLTGFDS